MLSVDMPTWVTFNAITGYVDVGYFLMLFVDVLTRVTFNAVSGYADMGYF
jgi:hypothetical protein